MSLGFLPVDGRLEFPGKLPQRGLVGGVVENRIADGVGHWRTNPNRANLPSGDSPNTRPGESVDALNESVDAPNRRGRVCLGESPSIIVALSPAILVASAPTAAASPFA